MKKFRVQLIREEKEKVTKSDPTANYFGPEKGPFECKLCEYFHAGDGRNVSGTCELVEGDIAPKACCNLFEPL